MLKGFIEEGSLRSLQGAEAGQEVVVLEEDIAMIITTTGIIGGEVAAGAGIGMIGTMAGNEVIVIEAGVVAIVQTMTEVVIGDVMMMSVGAGVALLKVLVLEGVCHLTGPLLGVEALIAAADHQAVVFHHQMVAILILGALHHVVLLRSDCSSRELEF